jgi:hypothetical protein
VKSGKVKSAFKLNNTEVVIFFEINFATLT